MTEGINNQLALISGKSGTGKSAALRNLKNQERWVYFNTEAGKRLPFKNNFMEVRVEDPYEIHAYFDELIANIDRVDGGIIDSVTFMMDMFETKYIYRSPNSQQGWADFQQFFKTLLQSKVVLFGKPVLMTAHTASVYNESNLTMETSVPVKGALAKNGIESYFSTVVSTKTVPLKELEPYTENNSLLTIEPEDEALGFKHVFQTRLTKATVGERIRSPMGLFSTQETYMNNDAALLLQRLHDFYEG
jgi:hypothetical protein